MVYLVEYLGQLPEYCREFQKAFYEPFLPII